MPFKPNYNFQKAERDRAKAAKKEEKLREKRERKAQEQVPDVPADTPPGPDAEATE